MGERFRKGGRERGVQGWRRHTKSGQGRAMQCEGVRVCSRVRAKCSKTRAKCSRVRAKCSRVRAKCSLMCTLQTQSCETKQVAQLKVEGVLPRDMANMAAGTSMLPQSKLR